MPSRTQLVCLCEGVDGSIDAPFFRSLIKFINPQWLRPWKGNNVIRAQPCGGRKSVITELPTALRQCLAMGGDTTLMVCADCDDDCVDGDALKVAFRREAERQGVTKEQFNRVVFVFAKDRLENWIQFLNTGSTDETTEGPRVKHDREVADAARKLAEHCKTGKPVNDMPPSLQWSCRNWRALVERMK